MIRILFLLVCLTTASTAPAAETYDLIFRNGTLDGLSRTQPLVYRQEVHIAAHPEAATRLEGEIRLTFAPEEMADLTFHRDEGKRLLGSFPATVGNPMIMYFTEAVIRDMASTAGGSPFYIRNRIKEALVSPAEVEQDQAMIGEQAVEAQTIRLYPFQNDPNRERMQGFADLTLSITMSEVAQGWYVQLDARAGDTYHRTLSLQPEG